MKYLSCFLPVHAVLTLAAWSQVELNGVTGNIYGVDPTTQTFELLKETEYAPKTNLGQSRFRVRWAQDVKIIKVEERKSFSGIKGPVLTHFQGIDDANAKAMSEGQPFVARVAVVHLGGGKATGPEQGHRKIVSHLTPDLGETPKSGLVDLNGQPVRVTLRQRHARIYVHEPLKPDDLEKGFWKVTIQGEQVDGHFVVHEMEVRALEDPRKTDDPNLPRVLVVGDSISMNYHESAKAALKGIANYHRNEGNSFSTVQGIRNMDLWLGNYQEERLGWDVIQFNHGLHDLKQSYDKSTDTFGDYAVTLDAYKENLEKEIAILKKTGAKLVWCSTTPIPQSNKGRYARRKGAAKEFNQAALEVMKKHPEIIINDLYGVVAGSSLFDSWRKGNDVHFYKKEEQKLLGEAVATSVRKALAAESPQDEEKNTVPPNVLMICIDDLNDWTGFLGGHPEVLTPHMDALAKRGRNFANAHCAVPVCSCSRVSVMSGVAATKHGSYEIGPSYQQLPALKEIPTIQQYFKDHGYLTLAGGKVLHQDFNGRLAGAIDRSLGRKRSPRTKKPMSRPADWSAAWDWGAYPEKDAEMADVQLAENAAKALQEDFEKPFFMSVGFFRPHVPLFVPPKWFELYDAKTLRLPQTPKSDLDDLPKNFLGINDYALAPTHAEVIEHGKQRSLTHAYLASVSFVDHCVGIVLEALKSSPHAENTLIVLWSDHGFHLGEKQHWAKRTLWEESTKVPLLFVGPGINPGEACREPASLLDIYPTLVKLCDLPASSHLEGVSLLPQLRDAATPRKEPAITSSYFGNHSVRSRDWRLISYEDGAKELYDHRTDSDEFHNLANEPGHKDTLEDLSKWLPKKAAPEFKAKSERARVRKK